MILEQASSTADTPTLWTGCVCGAGTGNCRSDSWHRQAEGCVKRPFRRRLPAAGSSRPLRPCPRPTIRFGGDARLRGRPCRSTAARFRCTPVRSAQAFGVASRARCAGAFGAAYLPSHAFLFGLSSGGRDGCQAALPAVDRPMCSRAEKTAENESPGAGLAAHPSDSGFKAPGSALLPPVRRRPRTGQGSVGRRPRPSP